MKNLIFFLFGMASIAIAGLLRSKVESVSSATDLKYNRIPTLVDLKRKNYRRPRLNGLTWYYWLKVEHFLQQDPKPDVSPMDSITYQRI